MPDQALAKHVRSFLAAAATPAVLADHPNDFALLRRVLTLASRSVEWVPVLVVQSDARGNLETYIDRRPDQRRFRHHAEVDADAMRWAFSYVNEGIV